MGGKKQGIIQLAGSLKTHWIQYVTELNMQVNPADGRAMAMHNLLMNQLMTVNGIFLQPGFNYKADFDKAMTLPYHSASILHLKFVNGQERKYHMGMTPWDHVMFDMEHIN